MKIAHLLHFKIHQLVGICLILFISINTCAANYNYYFKNQTDSLDEVVQQCTTDTEKFKILSDYFWHYANVDLEHVKHTGELAFDVIKSSHNIKFLSDGYYIKGIILQLEEDLDSAKYFFERSLLLAKVIKNEFRLMWCYYNLGEIYNSLGDQEKALDNMKKAAQLFSKSNNSWEELNTTWYIGDIYERMGNFDSALFYYNMKSAIHKKRMDKQGEIAFHLFMAGFYKRQNKISESLKSLNDALSLAEDIKNLNSLAGVYAQIGDFFLEQKKNYSIALDYYNKALEIADKKNSEPQITSLLIGLGQIYLKENKDSIALKYNLRSIALAEKINHRHLKSSSYKAIGFTYENLHNYPLAIKYFKKCFETSCGVCPKITFHQALIEIADINLKLNNKKEALVYYFKAFELAKNFHAKREIAITALKIGNFYCEANQQQLTKYYYELAINDAKEANDVSLIRDCANALSDYYFLKKDYKNAYISIHLAKKMNDSLTVLDRLADLSDLEMRFVFEKVKKDAELKEIVSKAEITRQKLYRNYALIITVLLSILGILVYLNYRRKKKDNVLLTKQKEEILSQKEAIESISAQLHEADQAKIRFFTNISHELRTPLTLIVAPLVKLFKNSDDDEKKSVYSLMLRNSNKLQGQINQLLDVASLDKGELKLNLKMHHLNNHLRILVSQFQSLAEQKNIKFEFIEIQHSIQFCFDLNRIELVINNMLSNAFKYTPIGGIIRITLSKYNNNAEIKVWDTGIGIPLESLDKVFERFYQVGISVSGNSEGSGIGLSIAKEIVELHQGSINVKSELGKWTEFTVLLPMNAGIANTVEREEPVIKIVDENKYTINKVIKESNIKGRDTVLFIEDNIDLRSYFGQCLAGRYNVLKALDGNMGIEMAIKYLPDIIVSDVMMPEKDGFQLTSFIKGNMETSHIPVILLTAKAGRESKIEGLEAGANDYINKPFDEEELLLKIKNILNSRLRMQEKFRKQISVNPSDIKATSLDEKFLIKLTTIIEKYLSEPQLDVGFLSKEIGMSRQHIHKKLKTLIDYSPNEFIRVIRLKRAAQLLKMKTGSVSEIAYETGFDNLSYFTKRFKEYFHILPSDYQ